MFAWLACPLALRLDYLKHDDSKGKTGELFLKIYIDSRSKGLIHFLHQWKRERKQVYQVNDCKERKTTSLAF